MATTTTTPLDIPALVGSEKQIRWAAALRAEKLAVVLHQIDEMVALARADGLAEHEISAAVAQARAAVQGVLTRRTHAGWWIEQRAQGALRTFGLD